MKHATARANELLFLPYDKQPPLAIEAVRWLCSPEFALTPEERIVAVTAAFAAYAHVVEGLPYRDPKQTPPAMVVDWFKAKRTAAALWRRDEELRGDRGEPLMVNEQPESPPPEIPELMLRLTIVDESEVT